MQTVLVSCFVAMKIHLVDYITFQTSARATATQSYIFSLVSCVGDNIPRCELTHNIMFSLAKEGPWAMHLTLLVQTGSGPIFVTSAFYERLCTFTYM